MDDPCRALDSDHQGCLSVLRHGFKCFGKLFRTAYFAPASGMNPETRQLYDLLKSAAKRGEGRVKKGRLLQHNHVACLGDFY